MQKTCPRLRLAMARFTHLIFAVLGSLTLILLVHAQDQSGFLSLDCGLPANSNYSEQTTGINYISDAPFIDTGTSESIASQFKSDLQQQAWNLRSFPQGIRNCYSINVTIGTKYLIRASFMYGNYDGKDTAPQFDLYLGANMWDTVKFENASIGVIMELIHVPSLNCTHICLVNTGLGIPFISAIELRPLKNSMYETKFGSLALFVRTDVASEKSYRYPYDVYDRSWTSYNQYGWSELSTSLTVDTQNPNVYQVPSIVMRTAATPTEDSDPLEFFWDSDDMTTQYVIYMHFAEIVKLEANQSRSFNITRNGNYWYGPFTPDYLHTTTLYSPYPFSGAGRYKFSAFGSGNSTLPPILNAVEIFSVKDLSKPDTDQGDVDAILKIKSTYGIKRIWQADPCGPERYPWDGLNCSYDKTSPSRIISLNLSSSGLTGEISVDISNLVMLQYLDLSNNSLTGSVPAFLSQLQHLMVLKLERNQLSGSLPDGLIARSKNGSLSLSVDDNLNFCGSASCTKKKNNIVVPIVASLGGLLILSLIVVAVLWGLRKRKQQDKITVVALDTESNVQNISLESIQRQFTYFEIVKMTNNFDRVLGKGGFGTVFRGYIEKTPVAVKILSPSSVQGFREFHSEVKLLMTVHHRNLTSLVGYCCEENKMGLIYEYMTNGDLQAHLSGEKANVLSWEDRLRIATDAAQGLEYLHHGCKPYIIHRDVKSTNILLDEHFHAKLADFGLSKFLPTDGGTHVSTVVAGTPGYLDPDYFTTNQLTSKSDVYSFGVVLLEVITSRPAIEKSHETTHISQWVSFMISKGDIKSIVDTRLRGNFNVNSAWKAVEIAMACVSPASVDRPTMSQVVAELKDCMAAESYRMRQGDTTESTSSVDMINMNLPTATNPSAR